MSFIFLIVFLAQWGKVCFWVRGSSSAEDFFFKMSRNWYYGKTCFIFSNEFLAQWEFVIVFSGLRSRVRFLQRFFFYFCVFVGGGIDSRRGHFFLFFIFRGRGFDSRWGHFFYFCVFVGGGFDSRRGHFFYFLFFEVGGSIPAEVIFLFLGVLGVFGGFRI